MATWEEVLEAAVWDGESDPSVMMPSLRKRNWLKMHADDAPAIIQKRASWMRVYMGEASVPGEFDANLAEYVWLDIIQVGDPLSSILIRFQYPGDDPVYFVGVPEVD